MPMFFLAGSQSFFAGEAKSKILHGQKSSRMTPIFKHLLFQDQLRQMAGVVGGHPSPQYLMVTPLNDGNGINLNIAQLQNGLLDADFATGEWGFSPESLTVQHQSPGLCETEVNHVVGEAINK